MSRAGVADGVRQYLESPVTPAGRGDAKCNLLPIDIAIAKGVKLAKPVKQTEPIALSQSLGRVRARSVMAGLPLPNFNNSAMDGYAVNTESLTGPGPYFLKINGRMAAGDPASQCEDINPCGAIRILTGALVPDAYDAVIMQENFRVEDGGVHFDHPPATGNNIRYSGEDCTPGERVVAAGTRLGAHHACLLAAQGQNKVQVHRKIRVAFFSTGSELRQPGEALGPGEIYNSNRFALAMQLHLPFVETIDLGTIPDDPARLKSTLKSASERADAVITTGGVSVGDEDHMPRLVTELGGTLHILNVAIKPGKPVTIGTLGDAIYIGLPGNPVAAFLNQMLIGRPILEKLAGLTPAPVGSHTAVAGFDRKSNTNRQEYVLARVIARDHKGRAVVEAFKKSGSAALLPLARSDGFVVLPAGLGEVRRGQRVKFISHH